MEVTGQLHSPTALPPEKEPQVTRRLGGPQSLCECGGYEKNICPCHESNPVDMIKSICRSHTHIKLNYRYATDVMSVCVSELAVRIALTSISGLFRITDFTVFQLKTLKHRWWWAASSCALQYLHTYKQCNVAPVTHKIHGGITLSLILGKAGVNVWAVLNWLRKRTNGGSFQ
jgi:hypothetical protein